MHSNSTFSLSLKNKSKIKTRLSTKLVEYSNRQRPGEADRMEHIPFHYITSILAAHTLVSAIFATGSRTQMVSALAGASEK